MYIYMFPQSWNICDEDSVDRRKRTSINNRHYVIFHVQTEFTSKLLVIICLTFTFGGLRPWQVQAGYSVSGVFGSRLTRPEVIEGDWCEHLEK